MTTTAGVSALMLSLSALAADPADEMSLMLVHDSFFVAHALPASGIYGSTDDTEFIGQHGEDNRAHAEQRHTRDGVIALTQQGDMNTAGLFQADGAGNLAQAQQLGQFNYLVATQSGSYNNADVTQNGSENRLVLDQQNGYNSADVTQNGSTSLVLEQGGGSTANITLGPGDPFAPLTLTIIQPPGDTLTITQP